MKRDENKDIDQQEDSEDSSIEDSSPEGKSSVFPNLEPLEMNPLGVGFTGIGA
jgi:hypothetical protein